MVLQAFAQYNLAVPNLAMALADTAERQLHTLTCVPQTPFLSDQYIGTTDSHSMLLLCMWC